MSTHDKYTILMDVEIHFFFSLKMMIFFHACKIWWLCGLLFKDPLLCIFPILYTAPKEQRQEWHTTNAQIIIWNKSLTELKLSAIHHLNLLATIKRTWNKSIYWKELFNPPVKFKTDYFHVCALPDNCQKDRIRSSDHQIKQQFYLYIQQAYL